MGDSCISHSDRSREEIYNRASRRVKERQTMKALSFPFNSRKTNKKKQCNIHSSRRNSIQSQQLSSYLSSSAFSSLSDYNVQDDSEDGSIFDSIFSAVEKVYNECSNAD